MKNKKMLIIVLSFLFLFSSLVVAKQYQGPIPTEFDQAPMFEKLVKSGELPPVEERIPEDPYVVDPNDSVGDYGGTLHSATITINSWGEDLMFMNVMNSFVKPNADASEIVPNFARKIESSDDKTTYTIYLRKGAKWSDGVPFTTEDILFWYEDLLLNEEYTAVVSSTFKDANGKVMDLEVIDDYTFKITFGTPKVFFLNRLVHETAGNFLFPKHYLKQFHPKYTSEEELQGKIENSNYDYWYQLLDYKNSNEAQIPMVVDRPTLTAYKLVERTSDKRVYERNPYFWKVDKEGNQLPYIDRIETQLVSNREVLNGMIMSGELDFAAYQTDIRNYPMYKQYEEKGGYRTITWTNGFGSDVIYMLNLTHQDPKMREVFQDIRFRKALSYGMNRDEINESIYFGKATPRQYTVLESSKYYEPEFAKAYVEYDPDKANKLLDEMGLKDVDGDGWREFADGSDLNFTIEFVARETPKLPNVELVTQHWQELGINVTSKEISGDLSGQRAPANLMDANLWHGDKATDILFPINAQFLVPYSPGWERTLWPAWSRWFQTDGDAGEEPPAEIKKLNGWWNEMLTEPDDEKRIKLGKKILSSQAENLWTIATVGGAPWPAVIDNDLRNIPDQVFWVWDTLWTTTRDPEQFYFENGVNNE